LIDRAVRRVLELKFRLGLFEHPYVDLEHARQVMHSSEHQQLALDAAREGIVLLKNEGNVLPLRKNVKSIAVIGPNANDALNLLGDYSPQVVLQHVGTILAGIKAKVSPETRVVYAKGCAVNDQDRSGFDKAVQAAKSADVAVLVLGEQSRREGEESKNSPAPTDGEGYDVASLDLTGVQEELVRAIQATDKPVVLVLVNGRPLSVRWEAEHIPAIVEAWQPGERGGEAIADVLFGDYNPSGRLAITVPRSVGQLPAYYNYRLSKSYWINGGWTHTPGYVDMPASPLYPFGYGLSYTEFQYTNAQVDPLEMGSNGTARVRVDVKNTGKRAGTETPQLYIRECFTPVATPAKQLRGFGRVALAPGEQKTVSFTLSSEDLQLLDQDMHWRVVPGTFDLMVGRSSADIAAKTTLRVKN
jgi:beta-glucosidase